ncbi:hypothetical protein HKX48_009191 [Thoreauomyces humboldtii]|nr:hypothetical protein HKX48_009191 [Thoreauomyces humboldtii]
MTTLTEAQVLTRARGASRSTISSLSDIQNLNLWGQNLCTVTVLSRLPNLTVLSLAINSITSLHVFTLLPRLTELYLRRNNVGDPRELQHLRKCSRVTVLWLGENPVAELKGYRGAVVRMMPWLRKLDERDVGEDERRGEEDHHVKALVTMAPPPIPMDMETAPGQPETRRRLPHEDHLSGSGMAVVSQRHRNDRDEVQHPNDTPPLDPPILSIIKSGSRPSPSVEIEPQRRPTHRPTWLTRAGESGIVKDRIRAASLDAQVAESPVGGQPPHASFDSPHAQDHHERRDHDRARERDRGAVVEGEGYHPKTKTRTNNVLFAVMSLLKELDGASLEVVAHEVARTLGQGRDGPR